MTAKKITVVFLLSGAVFPLVTLDAQAFGSKSAHVPASEFVPASTAQAAAEGIWIVRPDGSKQCEASGGQNLQSAEDELQKAGIKVLVSRKGKDGKLRAQMCGMASGSVNAYQINPADLEKALALGFQKAP